MEKDPIVGALRTPTRHDHEKKKTLTIMQYNQTLKHQRMNSKICKRKVQVSIEENHSRLTAKFSTEHYKPEGNGRIYSKF